jgi:hypothetical protein
MSTECVARRCPSLTLRPFPLMLSPLLFQTASSSSLQLLSPRSLCAHEYHAKSPPTFYFFFGGRRACAG